MLNKIRITMLGVCGAVVFSTSAVAGFIDPLVAPSKLSALAVSSPLVGITQAGNSLVAVGQRGHILVSENGKHWKQASVPVQSDLVAVHFPTAEKGWAVGHDGVVLNTTDGGRTWRTQLDGVRAAKTMLAYYEKQVQSGNTASQPVLDEAKRFVEQGPVHPFLDVWFESEDVGYVVGAFNLIFRTIDAGKTWEPWFDRTENPQALHLYGISGIKGKIYIVGEQGLVLRLDGAAQRFTRVTIPYEGSLFGVVPTQGSVVVFGMRGNAFYSKDGTNWKKVETGTLAGITGGAVFGDNGIALVTQGGELLRSADSGMTFKKSRAARPDRFAGIAASGPSRVALVGANGAGIEALK